MKAVRILTRSLAATAVTAATLGLASATYQAWGSARDRRRYAPPGDLIDIGGRFVHLWIEGSGTPAIVIVPALGDHSLEFAPLLPKLANESTTVVFDRAGLGWSDPVGKPLAHLDAADDLHTALRQAGIAPPYILVGHSMGGFVTRLFAAAHPEQVVGAVFIDSSHPNQHQLLPGHSRRTLKYASALRAKWYGLRRLAGDLGLSDLDDPWYPQEHVPAGRALSLSDRQRRTTWWELALRARIGEAVRRRSGLLGDIPITVLTCSEVGPDATTPRQIACAREHFRAWFPMQCDLATLSTDSKHVVADNAGHYIHRHQPDLVVEAILDVLRRADA